MVSMDYCLVLVLVSTDLLSYTKREREGERETEELVNVNTSTFLLT